MRLSPPRSSVVGAWVALAFVALDAARATDSAVRLISVKPTDDVRRSDFRVWHESAVAPRAVLVLVPGQNGDGAELFVAAEWKRFAAKYHLALVVPHFVSTRCCLRGAAILSHRARRARCWSPLLSNAVGGMCRCCSTDTVVARTSRCLSPRGDRIALRRFVLILSRGGAHRQAR